MTTYDEAVRSQRANRPVILYEITTTSTTYRHTTHPVDVTYGGQVYTSLTIAHGAQAQSQDTTSSELSIQLPITHPLVQRFASTGIPEQSVQVRILELQSAAGVAALAWSGPGQSISVQGHVAELRVPASIADTMRVQLPTVASQRPCNHVLGDRQCAPNPGGGWPLGGALGGGPVLIARRLYPTIVSASADGTVLTIDSDGGNPDGWFTFGTVTIAGDIAPTSYTGERQVLGILSHVGNDITVDRPIIYPGSLIGARVWLDVGCDRQIGTCDLKFGNRVNFGGHANINPSVNPWATGGVGVVQQA